MATLRSVDDTRRPLSARLLIGRSPSAALRLQDSRVSGEHAVIQWRRGVWELRDLSSRNGTFVNGERLPAGDARTLAVGTRVAFGHEENAWVFEDDGPPAAVAQCLDDAKHVAALQGILGLPSAEDPEVTVYANARGEWVMEREGEVRSVRDGAILRIGATTWRIDVPATIDGTATVAMGPTLDTVRLRFEVSQDEEHVRIVLLSRGEEFALDAREHAYVLLTLARLRLEDRDQPSGEQGWVDRDRLLRMLSTDTNALNVAIYRARGQLTAAGLEGASSIVEVRRGQRRFGIEPDRFEIAGF